MTNYKFLKELESQPLEANQLYPQTYDIGDARVVGIYLFSERLAETENVVLVI